MNRIEKQIHDALAAINDAWREGRPLEMQVYLHPDIVMRLPGNAGQISGRDALVRSFVEFCANARVIEYRETDEEITVSGHCAVASFSFEMLYERPGYRERSRGRDMWIFERSDDRWLAVWRTMTDLDDAREPRTTLP